MEDGVLVADYAVTCDSPKHDDIRQVAIFGVVVYAGLVPLMYLLLLLRVRTALLAQTATPLTEALDFLHGHTPSPPSASCTSPQRARKPLCDRAIPAVASAPRPRATLSPRAADRCPTYLYTRS